MDRLEGDVNDEEEMSEKSEFRSRSLEEKQQSAESKSFLSSETEAIGENESLADMDDNENDGDNEESDDSLECSNEFDNDADRSESWRSTLPVRQRGPVPDLPETVTKLETLHGSKVYVVGTAHFSVESQEDVAKTIQATQPDIVVVELCKGRVNILRLDEETILEEAKNMNLEKIRSTIKQNGFVHGIMYLFLLSMSAHLTKQLGMAPGGELRRAFSEARRVPGCLVHLGDRPIQVTLHRALAELSIWQKVCLAWCLITSKDPISKEDVERCKNRDLLEEMLAEMTGKFPVFSRVFVKERDIYLTHSLQLAASPIPCSNSDTGFIPAVVVGVVGIGHVPGIVENWGKIREEDIPPLLRISKSSMSNRVIKCTFKASMCCFLAWGCYKILARPVVTGFVSKLLPSRWPK